MYSKENTPAMRAQSIINMRHAQAIQTAEEHSNEVYLKCPELKEIDRELNSTAKYLYSVLYLHELSFDDVKKKNLELQEKKKSLLKSLHYPDNYLDAQYTCSKCNDTGRDTKTYALCSCFKNLEREEKLKDSGLGSLIDTQSFESFSLDFCKQSTEIFNRMNENLKASLHFATTFQPGKENLLLMGGTGLGKTHLSTSIAKEVVKTPYTVLYDSILNILKDFEYDKFKSGYSQDEPKSEKYLESDLLIIDDLGAEFVTPFSVSCIYQLINSRLISSKSTVINTNLTLQQIKETYDDRIVSRILGSYTILPFVGEDVRFQKLKL